ncbi:hypothetical protein GH733_007859 [Mirounga leonina]|nr:hypothetical protein GH733_007859 [Mirounga leonina]
MSYNSSELSVPWMKPPGVLAGAAFSCPRAQSPETRAREQSFGQMWLFLSRASTLQLCSAVAFCKGGRGHSEEEHFITFQTARSKMRILASGHLCRSKSLDTAFSYNTVNTGLYEYNIGYHFQGSYLVWQNIVK